MKRQILVDEYLPGRWGDDDDGDDDDDDDDKYRLVNICRVDKYKYKYKCKYKDKDKYRLMNICRVDGASHNKTNALLTGAS